ncbi:MAG: nucleotidyltransferase family protein [Xanthobacteraceae bacterium]|nr:MAG: nucleotidyltransferase family protein [Xanthobacteraceae bacterium]
MPPAPTTAMVLAAGLGTRMRPLTATRPKPLVSVAGKTLLDHGLDKLAAAGVATAIVNVHYLADQIERHVAARTAPRVKISDERDAILGTGGGLVRALPLLGPAPFFLLNSDTLWIDGARPNLARLADAFEAPRMDALLLLAPTATSIGYDGAGDYAMDAGGALIRRGEKETVPFVYAGAAILSPDLFDRAPEGEFALTVLFDRAAARGRLFGLPLEGVWMHVGTPGAIAAAEQALRHGAG